jgi:hypothetical protein
MARTAVIAGTATAVSGSVASKQQARASSAAAAAAADAETQNQLASLRADMEALQAQETVAAAQPPAGNLLAQLQQLTQLRDAGALTEQEFEIAKAKVLNG